VCPLITEGGKRELKYWKKPEREGDEPLVSVKYHGRREEEEQYALFMDRSWDRKNENGERRVSCHWSVSFQVMSPAKMLHPLIRIHICSYPEMTKVREMGSQGTDSPYMTQSPPVRSQRIHLAVCVDTK
jgi:hypothetical protein